MLLHTALWHALQVMYMHARGYCHRDLKPENCVIETATMTLKVRAVTPSAVGEHMKTTMPIGTQASGSSACADTGAVLDGASLVQVIDFGLSKHLESAATLGVGTPVSRISPSLVESVAETCVQTLMECTACARAV